MLAATADIPGAVPLAEQAGVTLRPIRKSDCRKLFRWYTTTVPEDERRHKIRSPADLERCWIKNSLQRDGKYGYPACYRSIMVGRDLAGVAAYTARGEVLIFIGPPALRSNGIGTKAMRLLLYEARMLGRMRLVAITARPDFFLKLGFRRILTTESRRRWKEADRQAGRIALSWGRSGGPRDGPE